MWPSSAGFHPGGRLTIPQAVAAIVGISHPVEITVGIPRLGIYLASAIFMFGFMTFVGRESIVKATLVALAVPMILFVLFEK